MPLDLAGDNSYLEALPWLDKGIAEDSFGSALSLNSSQNQYPLALNPDGKGSKPHLDPIKGLKGTDYIVLSGSKDIDVASLAKQSEFIDITSTKRARLKNFDFKRDKLIGDFQDLSIRTREGAHPFVVADGIGRVVLVNPKNISRRSEFNYVAKPSEISLDQVDNIILDDKPGSYQYWDDAYKNPDYLKSPKARKAIRNSEPFDDVVISISDPIKFDGPDRNKKPDDLLFNLELYGRREMDNRSEFSLLEINPGLLPLGISTIIQENNILNVDDLLSVIGKTEEDIITGLSQTDKFIDDDYFDLRSGCDVMDREEPRGGCNKEWWLSYLKNYYFNGVGSLEDRMFASVGKTGKGYIDAWRSPPIKPNPENAGYQGRATGDSIMYCLENWKESICIYTSS